MPQKLRKKYNTLLEGHERLLMEKVALKQALQGLEREDPALYQEYLTALEK